MMEFQSTKRGRARSRARQAFFALMIATAGALAAPTAEARADDEKGSLTVISEINQLRDAFNEDAGSNRLILLLSPT